MANENKKFLRQIYKASVKRDQKKIEELVDAAAESGENPLAQLSADDWKRQGKFHQQDLNKKQHVWKIGGSLGIFFGSFVFLFFILLLVCQRFQLDVCKNFQPQLTANSTPTVAATSKPTLAPTLVPKPFHLGGSEPISYENLQVKPPIRSALNWEIDNEKITYLQDSDGLQTHENILSPEDTHSYIGSEGGKTSLNYMSDPLDEGVYALFFSVDTIPKIPLLGDDQIHMSPEYVTDNDFEEVQEVNLWSMIGIFAFQEGDSVAISANVEIANGTLNTEFPLSDLLITKLSPYDALIVRNLSQLIKGNGSDPTSYPNMRILIDDSLVDANNFQFFDPEVVDLFERDQTDQSITGVNLPDGEFPEVEVIITELQVSMETVGLGGSYSSLTVEPDKVYRVRYGERFTPHNGRYQLAVLIPESGSNSVVEYDLIRAGGDAAGTPAQSVATQVIDFSKHKAGEWVLIGDWTIEDAKPRAYYVQATIANGAQDGTTNVNAVLDAVAVFTKEEAP